MNPEYRFNELAKYALYHQGNDDDMTHRIVPVGEHLENSNEWEYVGTFGEIGNGAEIAEIDFAYLEMNPLWIEFQGIYFEEHD